MDKELIFLKQHFDCKSCEKTVMRGFKYIATKKGEKYAFEIVNTYTLVFVLSGKALISCNEYKDVPIEGGEMTLWPMNSNCTWVSTEDTTSIVLEGGSELSVCDRKALREYADQWLNVFPAFRTLTIKKRLYEFLYSIRNYLEDNLVCPNMHEAKLLELSTLFRAYYQPEELMTFFLPTVRDTHEFKEFIMSNYLKMKGVKEFVDLSGMNIGTFNRKFKTHFNMTPYQWLIKQKSKHIFYELSNTDKSFKSISKEFQFTDASHFNRYCKAMFGAPPSEIRKKNFNG